MRATHVMFALGALALLPVVSVGQDAAKGSGTANAINGINSYATPSDIRYASDNDVDDHRIDMYINDWHGSLPRIEHGSLVFRDILTKGDNFSPTKKGAVLQATNAFSYAHLDAGMTTTPDATKGFQEVYYILGGTGSVSAAGATEKLRRNVAVLMPEGLEFTITADEKEPLEMYVINEPTPHGFKPRATMLVKDQAQGHQRTFPGGDPYIVKNASGHWAHIVTELFSPADGLATEQSVITVAINPLTLGEPHPHRPEQEEIWAGLDGDTLLMLGTQLRIQKPGMAYMARPDFHMIHSNANFSDKPITLLYFARFPSYEDWTHGVDKKTGKAAPALSAPMTTHR